MVNVILHKLDDHAEQLERSNKKFDVLMAEMAADRKLRDAQFELIVKRFEYPETK